MVDKLQELLPEYDGRATHAQCFLHTTNLVAKSIISVFDVKKKKRPSGGNADEIEELSEDLEDEEEVTTAESEGLDAKEPADNAEGLIDLTEEMEDREHAVHEEHVHPIKLVLVKVDKHSLLTESHRA